MTTPAPITPQALAGALLATVEAVEQQRRALETLFIAAGRGELDEALLADPSIPAAFETTAGQIIESAAAWRVVGERLAERARMLRA